MTKAIRQITIILENSPGALSKVSDILGKEGINVGAISLAESTDNSIIRLITDNPEKTEQVFISNGYHTRTSEVIAIETPDHPGGLNAVLKPLSVAGINVHYLYPYLRRFRDNAILIFRVSDTEKTIAVLKENYISVVDEKTIYSL
ncbi:MAG: ACT domain-containing protein [bacterium]